HLAEHPMPFYKARFKIHETLLQRTRQSVGESPTIDAEPTRSDSATNHRTADGTPEIEIVLGRLPGDVRDEPAEADKQVPTANDSLGGIDKSNAGELNSPSRSANTESSSERSADELIQTYVAAAQHEPRSSISQPDVADVDTVNCTVFAPEEAVRG